jgi:mannose-1-phosphate guanylyltransferase
VARRPKTNSVVRISPRLQITSGAELGYGWIEPGAPISNGAKPTVFQISGFGEKPLLHIARELSRRSCLLNTFIIVGTVSSLIGTIANALPVSCNVSADKTYFAL